MAKKTEEKKVTANEKAEQTNEVLKDVFFEKHDIKTQEDTPTDLNELSIFDLNQMLLSTEHLLKYYSFIANANVGEYPYDSQSIYKSAMSKIKQLETQKIEILNILEKKILS